MQSDAKAIAENWIWVNNQNQQLVGNTRWDVQGMGRKKSIYRKDNDFMTEDVWNVAIGVG
jgi:hypothetical protein